VNFVVSCGFTFHWIYDESLLCVMYKQIKYLYLQFYTLFGNLV